MKIKMVCFCVHCIPIEYFFFKLHRIKTIDNVFTQTNFQHLNEFAKIKSTKIKSIDFLIKFAKINQRKNIQIYGSHLSAIALSE